MKRNSDNRSGSSTRRRVLWGAGLFAGALVADLAETVVDPANTGEAAKFLEAATLHHDRMVVSAALLVASSLLIVPGVVTLARALETRGRRLGIVASTFAGVAAVGHVALGAFYLVFTAVPGSGLSRRESVAVIDHVVHATPVDVLAATAIAFPLAIVLVLLAAIRGGLAPRWALAPVGAAVAVGIAGPFSDAMKTGLALALFLGTCAIVLAQQPRDEMPVPVGAAAAAAIA
jgi:hypothetical protein